MQVLLQKPSGDVEKLEVDPSSSILDLVRAIQESDFSLRNTFFSLALGEHILKDDGIAKWLDAHGVFDGSILTLIRHVIPSVWTASSNGTELWSTATGECIHTFPGYSFSALGKEHRKPVLSADGSSVLTVFKSGAAVLWSTATGACTQTLVGHAGVIDSAAFSADGSSVLTVGCRTQDGTAKLWSTTTGTCTQTFAVHGGVITSAVLSADGSSVLTTSSNSTAKLWSTTTGACMHTFAGHGFASAVFSADGSSVLTVFGSACDSTAKLWSTTTGACTQTFDVHAERIESAVLSADGSLVLTVSDQAEKLWSTATGACMHTFAGHTGWTTSAVFSADGSSVLTGSYGGTAGLWSTTTGACTHTFAGHTFGIESAVFSANESWVLTASGDGTAKLWSTTTGKCTQTFAVHGGRIQSAMFSADGCAVLTVADFTRDGIKSDDVWSTADLWSATTGDCMQTFSVHGRRIQSAVFSACGSTFAGHEENVMRMADLKEEWIEWTVTLQKTLTDSLLGIAVDGNREDFMIREITGGLMGDWNMENPDKVVRAGDFIMSVNGTSGDVVEMVTVCRSSELLNMVVCGWRLCIAEASVSAVADQPKHLEFCANG